MPGGSPEVDFGFEPQAAGSCRVSVDGETLVVRRGGEAGGPLRLATPESLRAARYLPPLLLDELLDCDFWESAVPMPVRNAVIG